MPEYSVFVRSEEVVNWSLVKFLMKEKSKLDNLMAYKQLDLKDTRMDLGQQVVGKLALMKAMMLEEIA